MDCKFHNVSKFKIKTKCVPILTYVFLSEKEIFLSTTTKNISNDPLKDISVTLPKIKLVINQMKL